MFYVAELYSVLPKIVFRISEMVNDNISFVCFLRECEIFNPVRVFTETDKIEMMEAASNFLLQNPKKFEVLLYAPNSRK